MVKVDKPRKEKELTIIIVIIIVNFKNIKKLFNLALIKNIRGNRKNHSEKCKFIFVAKCDSLDDSCIFFFDKK